MLNPRGFFRFVGKFLIHPGTWVLFALLAVGIGFALPFAAPALMIFAAVAIGLAVITTFIHLIRNFFNNFGPKFGGKLGDTAHDSDNPTLGEVFKSLFGVIADWAIAHPWQAAIVGVGLGLLITALVLTIGFFTGGAAFAFMAPVFAAIAAPFATAAAAAGLQLGLAALAGTTFVLAALNITNIFHRLATWVDSFKYDYFAARDNEEDQPMTTKQWTDGRKDIVTRSLAANDGPSYPYVVLWGMVDTVKNGLASVDEDKLDPPEPPSGGNNYQLL